MEGVGAIGFGAGGVVVDFEEDAVDAGGDGGAGEDGDELGLSAGDSVGGGGCLDGVRAVKYDGSERAHDRQRSHVDDEIVIAEAGAALGEEDSGVAGGGDLFDCVLHVFRRDELAFFDVDGASGFAGGDEQVGLAAEECGNLEDVAGFRNGRAVRRLVHVGEDGKVCVFGDATEDARAFCQAWTAEAGDGGSVGLVVGGFKDVGNVEIGGYALDGLRHETRVLLAFNDAWAGDEEEAAASDGDAADFKVVLGH